jgi:hypothetical protein
MSWENGKWISYGVSDLVGKTLTNIEQKEDEELIFTLEDGTQFKLYHDQSCCEHVYLADVTGEFADLIGSPITMAEEVESKQESHKTDYGDSETWTFYKFATVKGYVTLRWIGSSNGYYSESVDFEKVTN